MRSARRRPRSSPYLYSRPALAAFRAAQGYVGVDGASITVSSVDRENSTFSISLIPETIERTTLGRLVIGEHVNVEVDSQTQTIVETIERVMQDPKMREAMMSQALTGDIGEFSSTPDKRLGVPEFLGLCWHRSRTE